MNAPEGRRVERGMSERNEAEETAFLQGYAIAISNMYHCARSTVTEREVLREAGVTMEMVESKEWDFAESDVEHIRAVLRDGGLHGDEYEDVRAARKAYEKMQWVGRGRQPKALAERLRVAREALAAALDRHGYAMSEDE